jgi:hypothetical protein
MIWVTILKFLKPFIPYILAAGCLFFGYKYIKNLGYNEGKDDGYAKAVKELAKLDRKCPDLKCPKYEPCPPAIDYDKMKARNIQVTIHQHNTVQMNADSLYFIKLEQLLGKKLNELEVVRTKRR